MKYINYEIHQLISHKAWKIRQGRIKKEKDKERIMKKLDEEIGNGIWIVKLRIISGNNSNIIKCQLNIFFTL